MNTRPASGGPHRKPLVPGVARMVLYDAKLQRSKARPGMGPVTKNPGNGIRWGPPENLTRLGMSRQEERQRHRSEAAAQAAQARLRVDTEDRRERSSSAASQPRSPAKTPKTPGSTRSSRSASPTSRGTSPEKSPKPKSQDRSRTTAAVAVAVSKIQGSYFRFIAGHQTIYGAFTHRL